MSWVCFEFFEETPYSFFIMTLPKPHTRVLFFLHPSQHLLYFNYLVTVTLVSVGVFSFGFMCIVLNIKGKCLFINLLSKSIVQTFLRNGCSSLWPTFNQDAFLCCYWVVNSLCVLDVNPWLQAWFTTFLPFHIGTTFSHRCVYVLCGHVDAFSHVCK